MNRQRNTRSSERVSGARRRRPIPATSPEKQADHGRPRAGSPDGAVISFLAEVLTGDTTWTMAEVQRLIAVRDLVELGRLLDGEDGRAQ